jgi:hypothetical protein
VDGQSTHPKCLSLLRARRLFLMSQIPITGRCFTDPPKGDSLGSHSNPPPREVNSLNDHLDAIRGSFETLPAGLYSIPETVPRPLGAPWIVAMARGCPQPPAFPQIPSLSYCLITIWVTRSCRHCFEGSSDGANVITWTRQIMTVCRELRIREDQLT